MKQLIISRTLIVLILGYSLYLILKYHLTAFDPIGIGILDGLAIAAVLVNTRYIKNK